MNPLLSSVFEASMLASALSFDAFAAAFAYGSGGIRVPALSALTVSGVCSAMLAASLALGSLLAPLVPGEASSAICFTLLFLLGLVKLFDSSVKSFMKKHKKLEKKIDFSFFNLRFIFNIYAEPLTADADLSRTLSPAEAAPLAAALSLDGLGAGFGAALVSIRMIPAVSMSLILGFAAIILGAALGRGISARSPRNFSWIGGAILIILAFMKIL